MKDKLFTCLDGYEKKLVVNLNSDSEFTIPEGKKDKDVRPVEQKIVKKENIKRRKFQETLDSYPNLLTG